MTTPKKKNRHRRQARARLLAGNSTPTPPGPTDPHTATGFADARFDGLLTPTGDTYNGQPVYTTPSGVYFCFRAGVWVATDMNPMTGTGEAYYVGTDTLTGSYTANFGPAPGGTVS